MYHLAYIFERFPSFTQTFCVREIQQLQRMGVQPLLFSIRDTREEAIQHFPAELMQQVHFLPQKEELTTQVRQWKDAHALPKAAALVLRHWRDQPDKARVYEAAYIAKIIADLPAEQRPYHAHSHFAGVGARTCWWLRKFTGMSYSFTAHANDIFCQPEDETVPFASLFEEAALVISVSDYSVRQLQQRFPQVAPRICRVYNGMDLTPFITARQNANRSRSAGGILSVGRLIPKKGYPDLIRACAYLRDWGIPFQSAIVGEGPLETELRTLINQLELQQQVKLIGPLSLVEIRRRLVEETQIFALACATESDGGRDNLPTVLMEAMGASLPCVSTQLAGVPEMVIPSVTGYLTAEAQPEAFAQHLATLLKDTALCEKLGTAGLAHAQAHFATKVTGRSLLHAFASHSGLRAPPALLNQHPDLRPQLRKRWWKRWTTPQLKHKPQTASSKHFDLAHFIKG